jgi:GT2 family glycosyltransferase
MKLSIIIVNYNGGKVLRPCLASVYHETQRISFEIILVDNASTDGSVEIVEKDFPNVKVIRNAENRGFAAANNIAIRQATGEYMLLLNADTEILDQAIEKTVAFMEDKPNIGVVGCKLLYADGTQQPSVHGYHTVLGTFLDATFLHLLLPPSVIVRERGITHFDRTRAGEVDWVIGAYFMMRKSLLDKIGLLDEQFWLYGEETDICQRAKDAGFETWYIPHAVVVHHWGMMTAYSLRLVVWMHLGRWLYIDKHMDGPRKYVILALRYFGAAIRVIVYSIVGCVTFKRQWFSKAYFFGVALFKMLTDLRRYDRNHKGEVIPWTEYI